MIEPLHKSIPLFSQFKKHPLPALLSHEGAHECFFVRFRR